MERKPIILLRVGGLLILLFASRVHGASFGGTAVILTSPSQLVVATDSRERIQTVLEDGTIVRDTQESCKVRQLGTKIAIAVGVTRAEGYDALNLIQSADRKDATVHEVAVGIREILPAELQRALRNSEIPARGDQAAVSSNLSLNTDRLLDVAIMDTLEGSPVLDVLRFRLEYDAKNAPYISVSEYQCPGDCDGGRAAVYLGEGEEIMEAVKTNPAILAEPSIETAILLAGIEYVNHTDTIGGPLSTLILDSGGTRFQPPGACQPAVLAARLQPGKSGPVSHQQRADALMAELTGRLNSVPELVVHDVAIRHSWSGIRHVKDIVDAQVQVADGVDTYSDIHYNGSPLQNIREVPGTWMSGEIGSILQATTAAAGRKPITESERVTATGYTQIGFSFEVEAREHIWTLIAEASPYELPFTCTIWIDEQSGRLAAIQWVTPGSLPVMTPRRINRVSWDVSFSPVVVSDHEYDVPDTATFRVDFEGRAARPEWIDSVFSNFRRYGASSSLSFK